jgi:hypothetical protein
MRYAAGQQPRRLMPARSTSSSYPSISSQGQASGRPLPRTPALAGPAFSLWEISRTWAEESGATRTAALIWPRSEEDMRFLAEKKKKRHSEARYGGRNAISSEATEPAAAARRPFSRPSIIVAAPFVPRSSKINPLNRRLFAVIGKVAGRPGAVFRAGRPALQIEPRMAVTGVSRWRRSPRRGSGGH